MFIYIYLWQHISTAFLTWSRSETTFQLNVNTLDVYSCVRYFANEIPSLQTNTHTPQFEITVSYFFKRHISDWYCGKKKIQMGNSMTLHRPQAPTRMWNKRFDSDMRNAESFCSDFFCFYGKMAPHDTPAPCTHRIQTHKHAPEIINIYCGWTRKKWYKMK